MERQILDYMVSYLRANTYQPSIREIGQRFGIKSTKTVSEHLQALARKGFLERDPSRSRGVKIIGMDLQPETVSIPCYSRVPSTPDERSADKAEMHLTLDRRLAGSKGAFFVRARGAELAAIGVEDGDFVLVEPVAASDPATGSTVVIRVGNANEFCTVSGNGPGVAFTDASGSGKAVDAGRAKITGRVTGLFRRMDGLGATIHSTAH